MQYIVLHRQENETNNLVFINTFGPFDKLEDARQWMLEDFSKALLAAERKGGKIGEASVQNRSKDTDLPEAHLGYENQTWQVLMLFCP